jgi:iron-sulfur cluster assembly protein
MLDITEKAAKFISSKCQENEFYRLKVKNSGCNGLMYEWSVEESKNDEDVLVESSGCKILIDRKTLPYVVDSTIDLESTMFSSTLKINNPLAKNTCGCGESFNV